MKAITLYRIASVLLVLFAAGHTFGFLKFKAPTPEGRAIFESMNNVHFQVRGATFSYGGFYTGFGLCITVYVLFLAFLSWHLGTLADNNPQAIGLVGWMLCLVQVATLVLSWKYFSAVPTIFAAVLTICLGWAAWLVRARG
jgi:hypothetical protein